MEQLASPRMGAKRLILAAGLGLLVRGANGGDLDDLQASFGRSGGSTRGLQAA